MTPYQPLTPDEVRSTAQAYYELRQAGGYVHLDAARMR
jgi:hypothetical protein